MCHPFEKRSVLADCWSIAEDSFNGKTLPMVSEKWLCISPFDVEQLLEHDQKDRWNIDFLCSP